MNFLKPGDLVYFTYAVDAIVSATVVETENIICSESDSSIDPFWEYYGLRTDGSISQYYYEMCEESSDYFGYSKRFEGENPKKAQLPEDAKLVNQFLVLDEPGGKYALDDDVFLTLEDARRSLRELIRVHQKDYRDGVFNHKLRARKSKSQLWREYDSWRRSRVKKYYKNYPLHKKKIYLL